AREFDLEYAACSLDEPRKLVELLRQTKLVVHAAGPFIHTARPMMEACLEARTHYLDITGEIQVFETAARLDERARQAKVMLLPGTGLDVVPTDCLALYLKKQLPDARLLQLAFKSLGRFSRGTAKTMIENLGESGAVRVEGKIRREPIGKRTLRVPFPDGKSFVMSIPWGDVSTAYHSTGIPNIEVYMALPPSLHRRLRWQRYFNWLLRTRLVRNLARRKVEQGPPGPTDAEREKGRCYYWGRVSNLSGDTREARLTTVEGYTLTAHCTLLIARKVLEGNFKPGFQTPARAYGENLILEVEGTSREDGPFAG
ncbi:MAG: hypothetical protein D6765_04035, partial [Bacteroidetes bacterium]